MNDDILTEKLRFYAEHGNIDMARCVEIAQTAQDALVDHSLGGEMPKLAAAMVRCCGADEDEAAYFRCAVDSLLQERWGAKPKDSAVFTGLMDMAYQGIWDALRAGQADEDDELDSPDCEQPDAASHDTPILSFNDLDLSGWTAFDEIKLRTEFHDGLREKREAALDSLEFEEFVRISNEMDDLRNDQIERLIAEIQKLQSPAKVSNAYMPLDEDLQALILKKSEATLALEFEASAEIETLIYESFGRTIARLEGEITMLRENAPDRNRPGDSRHAPTPSNESPNDPFLTLMKNNEFEIEIPEGKPLENGYVEMRHNTQYSLILKNHRWVPCDAEVVIDGIHVGTWRVESRNEIRIERPVHDTGHFTFFEVGSEEAGKAGIAKNSENGLVSVTFKPKKEEEGLRAAELPAVFGAGATGLTGESQQRFRDASKIEHDMARSFTIHLRLVSHKPDIRPLAPRSTPIPPPVG